MKKDAGKRMKTPFEQQFQPPEFTAKQKNFLIFSMLYSRPFLFFGFF